MPLTKPELRIWNAMSRTERQAWLAGARWVLWLLDLWRPTDLRFALDELEEEVGDGDD